MLFPIVNFSSAELIVGVAAFYAFPKPGKAATEVALIRGG